MQGLADHVCKKKAFQGFMMVIGHVKMLFKTIVRNRMMVFLPVLFFKSIVPSRFLKLLSTLYQMIQCLSIQHLAAYESRTLSPRG